MTDPAPSVLTALYALTGLLMAVFVGLVWELWRGWRTRGRRQDVWTHHRWQPEILNHKLIWLSCIRCGAVAVRHEN